MVWLPAHQIMPCVKRNILTPLFSTGVNTQTNQSKEIGFCLTNVELSTY